MSKLKLKFDKSDKPGENGIICLTSPMDGGILIVGVLLVLNGDVSEVRVRDDFEFEDGAYYETYSFEPDPSDDREQLEDAWIGLFETVIDPTQFVDVPPYLVSTVGL